MPDVCQTSGAEFDANIYPAPVSELFGHASPRVYQCDLMICAVPPVEDVILGICRQVEVADAPEAGHASRTSGMKIPVKLELYAEIEVPDKVNRCPRRDFHCTEPSMVFGQVDMPLPDQPPSLLL